MENIVPTEAQLIHKAKHNAEQEKYEIDIKAAIKIANIAFDSSISGWTEDIFPKVIRSYVITAWESSEETDPEIIAIMALEKMKQDLNDQLKDCIEALKK